MTFLVQSRFMPTQREIFIIFNFWIYYFARMICDSNIEGYYSLMISFIYKYDMIKCDV